MIGKKLQNPEAGLRTVFWFFTLVCLSAAAISPDRLEMLPGLIRICTQPVSTLINFFSPEYGGFSGAFLNTGLTALACCLMFRLPGVSLNDGSVVAFFLTVGLTARGVTILNFLQGIPGVLIYCLVKKQTPGSQVNAMIFTSGVCLLFTELLQRWPGSAWHDFTLGSTMLALAVGCAAGYLTAVLFSWNLKWENLLSLYTAALPVGVLSAGLNAVFYMLPGIPWPQIPNLPNRGGWVVSNLFLVLFFCLLILVGLTLLGGSWQGYRQLLKDDRWNIDYCAAHGAGNAAINLGCLGLLSVLYYNLAGAGWTSVTMSSILCMICTGCRGSKVTNVWPLLLGYLVTSWAACALAWLSGTGAPLTAGALSLVTGASFAVGLCPVVIRYGRWAGFAAGVMHYITVINVLPVIGEFCMYHGGFTAALVSFLLLPILNHFASAKKRIEAAP